MRKPESRFSIFESWGHFTPLLCSDYFGALYILSHWSHPQAFVSAMIKVLDDKLKDCKCAKVKGAEPTKSLLHIVFGDAVAARVWLLVDFSKKFSRTHLKACAAPVPARHGSPGPVSHFKRGAQSSRSHLEWLQARRDGCHNVAEESLYSQAVWKYAADMNA